MSPEGELFVDVRRVCRLVRFDKTGRFVASARYPGGRAKATQLAIAANGDIYFCTPRCVYKLKTDLSAETVLTTMPPPDHGFILDEGGPVAKVCRKQRPSRAVKLGELLFHNSFSDHKLKRFVSDDGNIVTIERGFLLKKSSTGTPLTKYKSAVLYRAFVGLRPDCYVVVGVLALVFLLTTLIGGNKRLSST